MSVDVTKHANLQMKRRYPAQIAQDLQVADNRINTVDNSRL
jgi:hypothetical protein